MLLYFALHLLGLLAFLAELGLLSQELLLKASLDSLFHWTWLRLGIGALLKVSIELLLGLLKTLFLNNKRIGLVEVLEQSVIFDKLVFLIVMVSREQSIVNIHRVIARWRLARAHIAALNTTTCQGLDRLGLAHGAADLVRLIL